jgi:hypothetical protein
LDGETQGTGTEVDWESEFDFADKESFRVDGFWRFANRHKVRFMYFENNRTGSRTLTRDIDFGDTTFPINTDVDAGLDMRLIELAYEYAFLSHDNLELSGSIGIHSVELDASLQGDIAGPGGGTTVAAREGSVTGPLPVLGFHVLWHMGGDFYLDGLAQFFYIAFDNFDGRIYDSKLAVTWLPLRNLGIGIGYNRFGVKVNVEKNDFDGKLKVGYGGPMAFFTVGF